MPLTVSIEPIEMFDDETGSFFKLPGADLLLEHSLISISKWEAKWQKPFLGGRIAEEKTPEQILDYIKMMLVKPAPKGFMFELIPPAHIQAISEYISSPQSATTFSDINGPGRGPSREVVTSELIYHWMVAYQIPFECEKWHLNRLLTLIRICEIKNRGPKKMSRSDIMSRNAALNAQRRAAMNTTG